MTSRKTIVSTVTACALACAAMFHEAEGACPSIPPSCNALGGGCQDPFKCAIIEGFEGFGDGTTIAVIMDYFPGGCPSDDGRCRFFRNGSGTPYRTIDITNAAAGLPWPSLQAAIVPAEIDLQAIDPTFDLSFMDTSIFDGCMGAMNINDDVEPVIPPPDTSILTGPLNPSGVPTATFTFASTASPSTFEVQLNGGGWVANGASTTKTYAMPPLVLGSNTFEVRSTDSMLQVDASPASATWTIVSAAPTAPTVYTAVTPTLIAGTPDIAFAAIGSSGVLTLSPTQFGTGGSAAQIIAENSLAVSPDRKLLLIGHNSSDEVESFITFADGSLLVGDVVPVDVPLSIAMHPTLAIAYVVDLVRPVANITTIEFDSELGQLTLGAAQGVADECRGIAVSPSGSHLVTSQIGFGSFLGCEVYSINGSGLLSASPVSSEPVAGSRLTDVAFDRTGTRVYAGDLDVGLFAFTFAGGNLTPLNSGAAYPTGNFLFDFVVSPTEDVLFTISATTNGTFSTPTEIRTFPINGDGTLGAATVTTITDVCHYVTISGDGRTLIMSSRNSSQIRSFSIAPVTFALTEAAGSPYAVPATSGSTPSSVAVND